MVLGYRKYVHGGEDEKCRYLQRQQIQTCLSCSRSRNKSKNTIYNNNNGYRAAVRGEQRAQSAPYIHMHLGYPFTRPFPYPTAIRVVHGTEITFTMHRHEATAATYPSTSPAAVDQAPSGPCFTPRSQFRFCGGGRLAALVVGNLFRQDTICG